VSSSSNLLKNWAGGRSNGGINAACWGRPPPFRVVLLPPIASGSAKQVDLWTWIWDLWFVLHQIWPASRRPPVTVIFRHSFDCRGLPSLTAGFYRKWVDGAGKRKVRVNFFRRQMCRVWNFSYGDLSI
jgi:hypothetical protein